LVRGNDRTEAVTGIDECYRTDAAVAKGLLLLLLLLLVVQY